MRESRTQYPGETENLVIVELSDQESKHEGKLKTQPTSSCNPFSPALAEGGGERSRRGAHMMFMFALNELLSLVFT